MNRKREYCEKCGKEVRKLRKDIEGKYVCWECYKEGYTMICVGKNRKPISFEDAVSRVYEIKGRKSRARKNFCGWCYFPKILVGHKFKIEVIK